MERMRNKRIRYRNNVHKDFVLEIEELGLRCYESIERMYDE